MTAEEVVAELKSLGSESTKKTLLRHGAKEPIFGVRIGDMKPLQKRIKKDYALALQLYDTGISDAMYLAGLIADDAMMTRKDLQHWVENASWHMLSDYTVPWVACGSKHGWELALKWIESKKETIATAGWSTLSCLVSFKDDADLDLAKLKHLLQRVRKTIHEQPNRVRYTMNGFIISVGAYVRALTDLALEAARQIGPVSVDMGDTACKVPGAVDYINKIQQRGTIGKKRKMVKC